MVNTSTSFCINVSTFTDKILHNTYLCTYVRTYKQIHNSCIQRRIKENWNWVTVLQAFKSRRKRQRREYRDEAARRVSFHLWKVRFSMCDSPLGQIPILWDTWNVYSFAAVLDWSCCKLAFKLDGYKSILCLYICCL